MTNRPGQYWTPEQGKALVSWWNTQPGLPLLEWDEERYTAYLSRLDQVFTGHDAHEFITSGGLKGQVFAVVLFVIELLKDSRESAAPDRIYKARHEEDARWFERLAIQVIDLLGLDLHFEIQEFDGERFRVVRRSAAARKDAEGEPQIEGEPREP